MGRFSVTWGKAVVFRSIWSNPQFICPVTIEPLCVRKKATKNQIPNPQRICIPLFLLRYHSICFAEFPALPDPWAP